MQFVCGHTRVLSYAEEGHKAQIYSRIWRCKSWDCPTCARKKARKYSNRTFEMFRGEKVILLTVTMDRSQDIETAWASITANWNRFRTAFVKRFGKLKFVRVVEPQPKSGYPHFHILINRYIPQAWLTKELASAGFGKIKDIKRVTGEQAFYYVTKYLRKPWPDTVGAAIAKRIHIRRYNTSRGVSEGPRTLKRYRLVGFTDGPDSANALRSRITEALHTEGVVLVGLDEHWSGEIDCSYFILGDGLPRGVGVNSCMEESAQRYHNLLKTLGFLDCQRPKYSPGQSDWVGLCGLANKAGLFQD